MALREHYQAAIEKSEQTYSKKLENVSISNLVKNREISFHEIAVIGDKANLPASETGTLIHRIAELRTLRHHSGDILAGKRFVELKLQTQNGKGGELDLVTIRGNNHYIHDYKPINIQGIESKPWAKEFNQWLKHEHNGDYSQIGNFRTMHPALHTSFRDFLKGQTHQFHRQLDNYRNMYSKQYGVPLDQIRTSVLPYYVKR